MIYYQSCPLPPFSSDILQGITKLAARLALTIVILHGAYSQAELVVATPSAQLTTLGNTETERFEVTGRVWPESSDEPHICLWPDDALATVSITIDDNKQADHGWWIEMGQKYDLRFTWFVIPYFLNQPKSYRGSWDQFRRLKTEGHDVQSHTYTHLVKKRGYDPEDPEHNLEAEYRKSKKAVEREIPNQACLTMAYSGGGGPSRHDPELASKFYIACRGGNGYGIAPVNKVNYLQVPHTLLKADKLSKLVDPELRTYRAWKPVLFHGIKKMQPEVEESLQFLNEHRKDIWTSLFREAAQYAQERDTARVVDVNVTDQGISFDLTDDMHDELFNYPLTIKLKLPAGWEFCQASQANEPLETTILDHKGQAYALVNAIPDRGLVRVFQ